MAYSDEQWRDVRILFESGYSLSEIVAMPDILITSKSQISKKSTHEKWEKGYFGPKCLIVGNFKARPQRLTQATNVVPILAKNQKKNALRSHGEKVINYGFVYLITAEEFDGIYKVGMTADPDARLSGMQTACPFKLFLFRCLPVENPLNVEVSIHKRFAGSRLCGEWFRLSATDLLLIEEMVGQAKQCKVSHGS